MKIPVDLRYSKTDEWVKVDGKIATIGITDFAQHQLSDIVFVEITLGKDEIGKKNTSCATVESVKAAADVSLPVSGKVIEINEGLSATPEVVNSDPYEKAWMLKVEISNLAEVVELMDAKAYETYCQGRSH
jgi:glycine cleavage system H protein